MCGRYAQRGSPLNGRRYCTSDPGRIRPGYLRPYRWLRRAVAHDTGWCYIDTSISWMYEEPAAIHNAKAIFNLNFAFKNDHNHTPSGQLFTIEVLEEFVSPILIKPIIMALFPVWTGYGLMANYCVNTKVCIFFAFASLHLI